MVSGNKRMLTRLMMIGPPIVFLVYVTQSVVTIRGLLSSSSKFHVDYANNLIQDYLGLAISLDRAYAEQRISSAQSLDDLTWLSFTGDQPLTILGPENHPVPVFLKKDGLAEALNTYFSQKKGLSALFETRYHEPVYWFRILDANDTLVYQSGIRPTGVEATSYPMTSSLVGYRVEIVYNSFGAKQLYSVSRQKINFGMILFLFILTVASVVLTTITIRQKLVWARQKSFFVTTVSHEFKTPLAIMRLAAETLQAKRFKTPDEEQRFLAMLTGEIDRLNHLIQKILSFNKMEMGQIEYHSREVDLHEVLAPSVQMFQAKAQAERLALVLSLCSEACLIKGDPDLIRHAIDNILDNAFKYRDGSDRIELSLTRDEKTVYLAVKDYGCGIAENELPLIYKSFYRASDPRTQGIRGSGLGLAISRHLLKQSGAQLEVTSVLRQGTTFTISFPALPQAQNQSST